jgi:hypothetical protein
VRSSYGRVRSVDTRPGIPVRLWRARMPPDLHVHTLPGRVRVQSMTAPTVPHGDWLTAAETIAPYTGLPKATWIFIILLMIGGLFRLLMERQLRLTLAEIFLHAPGGSVIVIRNRGLGGSMWIRVGTGPVPGPGSWPGRAELT